MNSNTITAFSPVAFLTNAGLARFHKDHGKAPAFDAIRVGESKESNTVQALYLGLDGTIWCGTAAGLYGFRPQDGEHAPHVTPLVTPRISRRPIAFATNSPKWASC